jgi:hypothetical protein
MNNVICLQCLKPVDKIEALAPIEDLSAPYWVFCHGKKSFVQLSVMVAGPLASGDWKVGVFNHPSHGIPGDAP